MPKFSRLASLVLALGGTVATPLRADEPTKNPTLEFNATPDHEAFFEKKVRPLLVARCLDCHDEKKQEGGLRLDSRGAVLKGNDSGPAIVAGKPDESRLVEVIGYNDPIKMPPKQKLADDEIATLTEWIKIGAPYPGTGTGPVPVLGQAATPEGIVKARVTHWAYQPVRRVDPPPVSDPDWNASPIDRFIFTKLKENQLTPSPPADPRTLLRRATFDLIGLPPTAEEVTAFESDRSEDAFAKVVDRLLASPHYGERWGRHWLDVARYADTKGYVFTEERKYPFSYTYRDYVIRAFNGDIPFDRFVLEQLAADQLPASADHEELAAMGFLTVGRRFGNNPNDIIDDRIDVVMRGLMGLTVTCARCHDHKYDAVPTDDYYSLYGVFGSSVEPAELPLVGRPPMTEAYHAFEQELGKLQGAIEGYLVERVAAFSDDLRAHALDFLVAAVRKDGEPLPAEIVLSRKPEDIRRELVNRWKSYLAETAKQPHPVFGPWHELARLPAEGFESGAAKVIAGLNDAPDAQPQTNALVKKALAEAHPKSMLEVAALYGRLLEEVRQQWLKVAGEKPAEPASGAAPAVPTALPDAAAEEVRQVLYSEKGPAAISRDEVLHLFDRAMRDKLTELKRSVESLTANSPAAPPRAMVLNDAPQPMNPHVFIRGNQGRPGKEVPRRFPQVVSPPDGAAFQKGSGRLELAQAIVSPANPLTARVIVNRVWMHHFGKGLVTTPSDFGVRGTPPSHPELLDFLAAAFVDDGWSLKKLHRRILLSKAWQQSSDDRPEALKVDPENHLVWKMNRQRLEFEPMRDALLAVAGRLDATLGGRPIDLFARPFTTRRAVYGFIDRQDLPGTFRVFDLASPDVSTPMRAGTTVPQQALYGMNSPFVVEQAKALAARPEMATTGDTQGRIQALYRLVYARPADADEIAAGSRFLDTPPEPPPAAAAIWEYGYGEYDETAHRVRGFTPLPHFQEGSWRGGPALPDPAIGSVILTADGGHPGADLKHTVIRRWTAPAAGFVRIAGTISHPQEEGDGVRGRIVSSRGGELGSWTVHHGKVATNTERIEAQAGETLDFVVDCLTNEGYDTFAWEVAVNLRPPGGGRRNGRRFESAKDFHGPLPATAPYSALEQYAQALLLANEFLFVD